MTDAGGPDALRSAIAPLVTDPGGSVLLFDFDGTLSPTVADPASARLAEGFGPLLAALAVRYRTVALVSGRPVSFLAPHAPEGVVLSGQYGLERRDPDGEIHRHPAALGVDVGATVDELVALGVPLEAIEPKGLSLTVHHRTRPDDGARFRAAAEQVAGPHGLVVHDAKQSVELRVPVAVDKGTVVHDLGAGATGVLYAGDDLGDLPAFAALADLRASGTATVGVAVTGPEVPDEVVTAADATVAGIDAMAGLLRALVAPPA